jgi:outer membrane lipoprotein-sorting protein
MRSSFSLFCVGIAGVLSLMIGIPAQAQSDFQFPAVFQADVIVKNSMMPDGSMQSKIYMDGNDRIRTESNIQGVQAIAIFRRDKNVMYTLMPAQKMAMEMPMTDVPDFVPDTTKGPKPERLGEETVDGVACVKWKFKSDTPGAEESFFWVDKQTNFPVKMRTADGATEVIWKNVSTAKPDSSLFEVPGDYKKQAMPQMPPMPQG